MIFYQQHKKLCYLAILFLSFYTNAFALPFNITVKAGTTLPTTVGIGSPATAYYTITNPSVRARNNNVVRYLPANVSQVTSGGTYSDTCASTINLAAGASCTLQLSITGVVKANDPDPHHHIMVCYPGNKTCAGTREELNVSAAPFGVVVNAGNNTVSVCPINSDGTFGSCVSNSGFNSPVGIALTKDKNYVYVSDQDHIVGCNINFSNGNFYSCVNTAISGASGMNNVVLNKANTVLYVTDFVAQTVYACASNASTHTLNNCTAASYSSFGALTSVALNQDNTRLYVGDYSGKIYNCTLDSAGNVAACSINSSTPFSLSVTRGIAINQANTLAYFNTDSSNTYKCDIVANGEISNCISAISGASFPYGLKLTQDDTQLYLAESGANDLYICNLNSQGTPTACNIAVANLNTPNAIDISN